MTRKTFESLRDVTSASIWYQFDVSEFPKMTAGMKFIDQVDFLVFEAPNAIDKIALLYRLRMQLEANRFLFEDQKRGIYEHISMLTKIYNYQLRLEQGITEEPNSETKGEESKLVSNASSTVEPIRWQAEITALATMYFKLLERGNIKTTKTNLENWIVANFLDRDGNHFKATTIRTYLNESKPEKRANVGPEFSPDSLLSNNLD